MSLFNNRVSAVLTSDNHESAIIRNKPEDIKPTQQHKLIKVESDCFSVESVSEEHFNKLENELDQREAKHSIR